MKSGSQLSFGGEFKRRLVHGGEHSIGKRKVARPVSTRKAMHVTLRSSHAVGELSFRRSSNLQFIETLLPRVGKKWGVRIYRVSVNGNHIHLALKADQREGFQNFLRVVGAQIARFITGARRGKPFGQRFWDLPAFSRIVEWGKGFETLSKYVRQNVLETLSVTPYQPRKKRSEREKLKPQNPNPKKIQQGLVNEDE